MYFQEKRHHDQIQQSLNLKYSIPCPLLEYVWKKKTQILLGGVKTSRTLINLGIKPKASMSGLRNGSLKSHFKTDPWGFGDHQNVTAWNLGDKVYQYFFEEISRWCLQWCWHRDTHSPLQIFLFHADFPSIPHPPFPVHPQNIMLKLDEKNTVTKKVPIISWELAWLSVFRCEHS